MLDGGGIETLGLDVLVEVAGVLRSDWGGVVDLLGEPTDRFILPDEEAGDEVDRGDDFSSVSILLLSSEFVCVFDLCGILKLLVLNPVPKPRAKLAKLFELVGRGGVFGFILAVETIAAVEVNGADEGFKL